MNRSASPRVDAERARRRIAAAVAVLANAAFLIALDRLMPARMRSRDVPHTPDGMLIVRLIDAPDETSLAPIADAPSPETDPPPVHESARVPTRNARRAYSDAPSARPSAQVEPAPAPALNLFDVNGHVRVPNNVAPAANGFFPMRPLADDSFARSNPLPYAPTGFESMFPPLRETRGEELIRRTTVSHAWRTPWGTQIKCVGNPLFPMAAFGCGWGPEPHATAEELARMRVELPPLKKLPSDDAAGVPAPAQ